MNTLAVCGFFSLRRLAIISSLVFGGCVASAQAQTKSTAPKPAVAKPAAPAPAKPPAPASKPGGATTASGPTTAGASHGPTTANPHTATPTANHITTANTGHPATTTTAGHGNAPMSDHRVNTATVGRPGEGRPNSMNGHPVPRDSRVVHTANGNEVRMRANGRPAEMHLANRGMDIHHGLDGRRRVEVVRGDHRIVAERGGRGYVERPYRYGGREFAHRTYYYHGRAYDHYYGHYYYRGVYVNYYTPVAYYRPAFYGWVYNPWAAPVAYSWGWGGNPWYGYYGFYFAPYPVYPSASLWLTDYMISATLAAAYQAQVDANIAAQQAAAAGAAPLTPEVKDMIAAEVQRQIALENSEAQSAQNAVPDPASSSIQRMLSDNVQHVFVAGRDLDVVDVAGTECGVSEGDALELTGPLPQGANAANLVMLSSKGGPECRKGDTVSVAIADLQEMQNHMRETIDQGMSDLQAKQGNGGLPAIPPSANAPPVKAAFAASAPGPDPGAAAEINQQAQEADQAENEALNQVAQNSGPSDSGATAAPAPIGAPAPPPATLSLGQTLDEVTAIEGQPKTVVDLGTKKIYVFKDGIKVTFKNGKSTDIQ